MRRAPTLGQIARAREEASAAWAARELAVGFRSASRYVTDLSAGTLAPDVVAHAWVAMDFVGLPSLGAASAALFVLDEREQGRVWLNHATGLCLEDGTRCDADTFELPEEAAGELRAFLALPSEVFRDVPDTAYDGGTTRLEICGLGGATTVARCNVATPGDEPTLRLARALWRLAGSGRSWAR